MKKSIFIAFVVLAGLIYFVKQHGRQAYHGQDAVVVEVQKIKSATIPLTLTTVGNLVAAHNIQIAPESAGQVAKILFQDGTFVTQGTPLIQLNNSIYQARYDSMQADLDLSQTTLKRSELLAKKGIISQQDLEKTAADLKEKQAAVEGSSVELSHMLLAAPFDGVVGKSLVSPGDYVTVGQALVALTDTRHLRVEYTVAEKYFALLKLGQEVRVTSTALPGKEFTGKVAYISPTLNVENRTVSVYAEIPNDNQVLSPGLFVNVTQSLGTRERALLVNAMSLVGTIDGEQVFRVKNGKAEATPVEVGQRMLDNVEILKGIDEGDSVIVAGQQKIRDGEDVVVKT